MSRQRIGMAVAGLAALAGMVVGGAAIASADETGADATGSYGLAGQAGEDRGEGYGPGPGGHEHEEVTGSELADVEDAVAGFDSTIDVEGVMKDEDGSYDVMGTRDGSPVVLEVSADLGTISERAGDGPRMRGRGGHGGLGDGDCDGDGPHGFRDDDEDAETSGLVAS
jgi:hypothetical protein